AGDKVSLPAIGEARTATPPRTLLRPGEKLPEPQLSAPKVAELPPVPDTAARSEAPWIAGAEGAGNLGSAETNAATTAPPQPAGAPPSPQPQQSTTTTTTTPLAGACSPGKSPWDDLPPISVYPRTGYFPIQPTGAGYYSLKDELENNYRQGPPKY